MAQPLTAKLAGTVPLFDGVSTASCGPAVIVTSAVRTAVNAFRTLLCAYATRRYEPAVRFETLNKNPLFWKRGEPSNAATSERTRPYAATPRNIAGVLEPGSGYA